MGAPFSLGSDREFDIDISAHRVGIGADLVCLRNDRFRRILIDTGNRDIECNRQGKTAIGIRGHRDGADYCNVIISDLMGSAGDMNHRIAETGGIACRKQLFGIGRAALATQRGRYGEIEFQQSVVAGDASATPAGGSDLGRIQCAHDWSPFAR